MRFFRYWWLVARIWHWTPPEGVSLGLTVVRGSHKVTVGVYREGAYQSIWIDSGVPASAAMIALDTIAAEMVATRAREPLFDFSHAGKDQR